MSYRPRYDKGDWSAICDICGRKVKASELRRRWDGFMVDDRCWEPRHPQDFVRGVADFQAPVYTRPESANQFISIPISVFLESGSYRFTAGYNQTFNKIRGMSALVGSYTYTGYSVLEGTTFPVNNGSYTYTGVTASFAKAKVFNASAGAYTYTGVAAIENSSRSMSAVHGTYTYTGYSALMPVPNKTLGNNMLGSKTLG